jgi:hypothetical protein
MKQLVGKLSNPSRAGPSDQLVGANDQQSTLCFAGRDAMSTAAEISQQSIDGSFWINLG